MMRSTPLLAVVLATCISALPTNSSMHRRYTFADQVNYAQTALYHHNIHRQNHSAPDLEWDTELASTAAKIAQDCVWGHNMDVDGGGYGQNLAAGLPDSSIGVSISDLWYNREMSYYDNLYNESQPSYSRFEQWGHFTQLVWKSSTAVGCASNYCVDGLSGVGSGVEPWITVCNYKRPGNWADEYADNVGLPQGMAVVTGDSPVDVQNTALLSTTLHLSTKPGHSN